MVEINRNSGFTEADRVYQEARERFNKYLENLSPPPPYQTGETWRNYREHCLETVGEESLITLYPESPDVNHHQILRPIYGLRRLGIKTKDDLFKYSLDRKALYKYHKKFSTPKPLEVGKILQDLVIAEKYREWNSWNK